MYKKIKVEEALIENSIVFSGELERLKTQSEDWLGVLNMPLHTALESREFDELLRIFFPSEHKLTEFRSELELMTKPEIKAVRRITRPASVIEPTEVNWIVPNVLKVLTLFYFKHIFQPYEDLVNCCKLTLTAFGQF